MLASKHTRTLAAIFANPVKADIRWTDIESLFRALGGEIKEGAGSRVRVELRSVKIVLHRPHPRPETDKGAVVTVRKFLTDARVNP